MTDNEIIKALERCPQHTECCYCNSLEECGNKRILTTSVFDLINRQKAEIEELKKKLQYYLNTNEENGVVYIPKFVVDNLVKERTNVETNQKKEDGKNG